MAFPEPNIGQMPPLPVYPFYDKVYNNTKSSVDINSRIDQNENINNDYDYQTNLHDTIFTEIIREYIFGAAAPVILSGFGIVTNVINIMVFYRQGILADSCTPILVGLALSDFFFCLFTFFEHLMDILHLIADKVNVPYSQNNALCMSIILGVPGNTLGQFACWVTLYLTLERMVSVTFPFHVKMIFKPRRSCLIMLVIFIVNFVLYTPNLFIFKLSWRKIGPGESEMILMPAQLIPPYFELKAAILNVIVLRPISIILVVLFNIIIIFKVKVSKQFQNTPMSNSTNKTTQHPEKGADMKTTKREIKLTRMILVICLVFIVSYVPRMVYEICHYAFPSLSHNVGVAMVYISELLELVNSSVNFIIYYTMSSKFKTELQNIQICRKRIHNKV